MRGASRRSASPTRIIRTISRTRRFLQDRGAEILEAAGRAAGHEGAGHRAELRDAPARHLPHGQRPGDVGGRQVPSQPRCPESVSLRRQQPGDLGPRPADDDDPGAGVPRRRAHRALREARRDLGPYGPAAASARGWSGGSQFPLRHTQFDAGFMVVQLPVEPAPVPPVLPPVVPPVPPVPDVPVAKG